MCMVPLTNIAMYVKIFLHAWVTMREVAHDCQTHIAKYLAKELSLLNYFCTWHGKCAILLYVWFMWMYKAGNGHYVTLKY